MCPWQLQPALMVCPCLSVFQSRALPSLWPFSHPALSELFVILCCPAVPRGILSSTGVSGVMEPLMTIPGAVIRVWLFDPGPVGAGKVQEALAACECLLPSFPPRVSWVQAQVHGFVMMPRGSQAFLGSYPQGSWSGANASRGGGGNATPYLRHRRNGEGR